MPHVGWRVTKLALFMLAAGLVTGTSGGGCSCDEKLQVGVDAADPDASIDAAVDAPIDARLGPQIHYLKASNTEELDDFGWSLAASGDGNTVAIGAPGEASGAVGVNGNQSSNTSGGAGAVYVFVRSGTAWVQEAYVKASNTGAGYDFGDGVALSYDGNTLAVGSPGEHSAATGINQSQANDNLTDAGAAYVFSRTNGVWTQQAYVKASNTGDGDMFGGKVALSGNGDTLVVGAHWESSSAIGVNGDQTNDDAPLSGAVYVFTRSNVTWTQQAYVKASNTQGGDYFGSSVALSASGDTMAVMAMGEKSAIAGDQADNSLAFAGAVYVFRRAGIAWAQEAYLKASFPSAEDYFGNVALSGDGSTLAVGSSFEDSASRGINGNAQDNTAMNAGAVYIFVRGASTWSAQAYIKASNADVGDLFGSSVALTASGDQLLVGARGEAGAGIGYGGNPASNGATYAGAAYRFTRTNEVWAESSYLKASNAEMSDSFGAGGVISASGSTILISATRENSSATGVNGDQTLNDAYIAGASYIFE